MYNSDKFIDNIDAILYVNLVHRGDRNSHIQKEIRKIDSNLKKTHRIDAVYKKDIGALGCALSHIKALQLFLENTSWNTCLILEDDFTFKSNDLNEINYSLNYTLQNSPNFDVILLSFGKNNFESIDTENEKIKKVISSQTTSGYIIKRTYVPILLNNLLESSSLIEKEGLKHEYWLDQYWKRLMPNGNWYTYKERIGYQYNNYSDIEKKICNYGC
jgi:glycosyl transferase family 25